MASDGVRELGGKHHSESRLGHFLTEWVRFSVIQPMMGSITRHKNFKALPAWNRCVVLQVSVFRLRLLISDHSLLSVSPMQPQRE